VWAYSVVNIVKQEACNLFCQKPRLAHAEGRREFAPLGRSIAHRIPKGGTAQNFLPIRAIASLRVLRYPKPWQLFLTLEKLMRKFLGLVVFMATAALVVGNEDKKPSLDGTYVMVAIEMKGEKIPDETLKKLPEEDRTITIKGDKLIRMGKNKEPIELKIDASKTPAEIDTKETKGDKPEMSYGIYKLEGDTLTICLVEDGKAADRPKEFKTMKDSKLVMLILKKKEK
jgi:uncharacterized protein (TIGR03067 family)